MALQNPPPVSLWQWIKRLYWVIIAVALLDGLYKCTLPEIDPATGLKVKPAWLSGESCGDRLDKLYRGRESYPGELDKALKDCAQDEQEPNN